MGKQDFKPSMSKGAVSGAPEAAAGDRSPRDSGTDLGQDLLRVGVTPGRFLRIDEIAVDRHLEDGAA